MPALPVQDAIEEYTSAFCNLDEVAGVAEFPDVKPRVEVASSNGSPDDKLTTLAWN